VKRTVGIIVGVVAVAVAAYLGSRLWAQPGAAPAHPGASTKTKVAVLNLKYVVMNYKKWKDFTEQLKVKYQDYENRLKPLNTEYEGVKKELQSTTIDQAKKDELVKKGKNLERQMQDIGEEAKNTLGKQEGDEMAIIYKEIASVVSQYAVSNDIDLVMHYNDATSTEEMNSAGNIQRKMVTGPCIPLYYKQNEVDISYQIMQLLNSRYTAQAPAAPGTPGHQ
jgi:Skp family chaperone for outer membrane proteins